MTCPTHWLPIGLPRRHPGAQLRPALAGLSVLLTLPLLAGCVGPLQLTALQLATRLLQPVLPGMRCPRLAEIDGSQTPLQLYRAMDACLSVSDPETAMVLFSLASAYGRYDTLRVADPSAHQAGSILRALALRKLTEPQRRQLAERIEALDGDPQRQSDLCATLERIGPPRYQPEYMLRHGLRGLSGRKPTEGPTSPAEAVEGFAPSAAWNQVLDRDVGCSKA